MKMFGLVLWFLGWIIEGGIVIGTFSIYCTQNMDIPTEQCILRTIAVYCFDF